MFKGLMNQVSLMVMLREAYQKDQELKQILSFFDMGDYRRLSLFHIDLKFHLQFLCECEDADTLKIHRKEISRLTVNYLGYVERYKAIAEKLNNEGQ